MTDNADKSEDSIILRGYRSAPGMDAARADPQLGPQADFFRANSHGGMGATWHLPLLLAVAAAVAKINRKGEEISSSTSESSKISRTAAFALGSMLPVYH
jgi:hypothetical protein